MQRADFWTQWGEREGGTNWEGNIETYTPPYKIDSQWEFAEWRRGLIPVSLWQPRGVGGIELEMEGGRGHMYTYGWYMLIYGKNQLSIVKQLSSNYK